MPRKLRCKKTSDRYTYSYPAYTDIKGQEWAARAPSGCWPLEIAQEIQFKLGQMGATVTLTKVA